MREAKQREKKNYLAETKTIQGKKTFFFLKKVPLISERQEILHP